MAAAASPASAFASTAFLVVMRRSMKEGGLAAQVTGRIKFANRV
jgi:hypothetical protein